MSESIVSAYVELQSFATNQATPAQTVFLNQLIDDLQPHIRRPIFSKEFLLEESLLYKQKHLGRKLSKDEISQVIDEVAAVEISGKTLEDIAFDINKELAHSFPLSGYARVLKETLDGILAQHNQKLDLLRKDIKDFLSDSPESYDRLYHRTVHEFNGSVMLPIQQGVDHRMGTGGGECAGYAAVWAQAWLEGKAPFGIQPTQAPPFSIVPPQSKTAKKFFDINHLAVVTPEIGIFQRSQQLQLAQHDRKYSSNYAAGTLKQKYLQRQTHFYTGNEVVAKLIQEAERNCDGVYNLSVWGIGIGHALAFKKDPQGNYHYLDPVCGWFRFKNTDDFRRWFCFYWKEFAYERKFIDYTITRYQQNARDVQNREMPFGDRLSSIIKNSTRIPRMILFGIYRSASRLFENGSIENIDSQPTSALDFAGNHYTPAKCNPQAATPSYKAMLSVLNTDQAQTISLKSKRVTIALATDEEKRNFHALDLAPSTITISPPNTENSRRDALDLASPCSLSSFRS